MSYLLDTNVLSELRKGGRGDPRVVAWGEANRKADTYTSAMCIGEVRDGIERIRRRDPRFGSLLETWLVRILAHYEGRVLPVDVAVAECWGRWNAGRTLPTADGLIAATAAVHGLTLVTRDTTVAERVGVPVFNPFVA